MNGAASLKALAAATPAQPRGEATPEDFARMVLVLVRKETVDDKMRGPWISVVKGGVLIADMAMPLEAMGVRYFAGIAAALIAGRLPAAPSVMKLPDYYSTVERYDGYEAGVELTRDLQAGIVHYSIAVKRGARLPAPQIITPEAVH